MRATPVLFLSAICLAAPLYTQQVGSEEYAIGRRDREIRRFTDVATVRFQEKGVSQMEVQELAHLKISHGKTGASTDLFADRSFLRSTESITTEAKLHRILSEVTLSTEVGGATVKYQTIGQRGRGEPPVTAKRPTNCQENMAIGFYHIWTERYGKVTSDKDARFTIVEKREAVKIVEK